MAMTERKVLKLIYVSRGVCYIVQLMSALPSTVPQVDAYLNPLLAPASPPVIDPLNSLQMPIADILAVSQEHPQVHDIDPSKKTYLETKTLSHNGYSFNLQLQVEVIENPNSDSFLVITKLNYPDLTDEQVSALKKERKIPKMHSSKSFVSDAKLYDLSQDHELPNLGSDVIRCLEQYKNLMSAPDMCLALVKLSRRPATTEMPQTGEESEFDQFIKIMPGKNAHRREPPVSPNTFRLQILHENLPVFDFKYTFNPLIQKPA